MSLITTTEAAKRLKVSRPRIYQLIAEGKLEAEKYGRDFLIREADLKRVTIYGKPGRPVQKKA